ncbi:MAG: exodeoxyribonuclease VII large subunit, partial [Gammaproteobacteria bacterium]|nr:exodeoxyribonuclease VII large subunit [Gammaproteobacteria bacterium]
CEQSGNVLVTQLDKDDLERIGLVKFDFLGLRTLTIIDKTIKTINSGFGGIKADIKLEAIDTEDPSTYSLIKSGRTTALFQLESRGMRDVIQRLQPDRFGDLVALVALYRPGPMRMIDDFVNRKHGRIKIEYPHPALEPILSSTYGVILYQEQVMQIAQVLAGYSLGSADLLRRAMGKKKPAEMALQREVFLKGAQERGVESKVAGYIFDLMERFAGYGFGKSHSAAYALISYHTAWLKTHFPAPFMAASLSADMEHTDKIVRLLAECRELGIEVRHPDINRCQYAFVPIAGDKILYGVGAIKGIGQSAIEVIVEARRQDGEFKDLFDLCGRIDLKRVNRRVLESLIRSGALDAFGENRATLMFILPLALETAGQQGLNRDVGQTDLFGVDVARAEQQTHSTARAEWSEEERLRGEKETLGLYLTGHPLDRYQETLAKFVKGNLAELDTSEDRLVVVAGLIAGLRTRNTRRGERMAFVTLDDQTARVDVAVFSDLYAHNRDVLRVDNLVVMRGRVSVDDYTGGYQMRAEEVYDIENAQAAFAKRLIIDIEPEVINEAFTQRLETALRPYTDGSCPVYIHYCANGAEAGLAMGSQWNIQACRDAVAKLNEVVGEGRVRLLYN